MTDLITFVSHTNKPGGGELALRRYLEATKLKVRLVTMEPGGVWEGLRCEVLHAPGLLALRRDLRDADLVVANSMRAALLTALVAPRQAQFVYWVRDGLADSAMSPLALALTKHVTARRANLYLANSEWTANAARDALRVEPERVHMTYSMSGVTEIDLHRSPRQALEASEPLRLLYLGRIAPWKAPDVAIQALAPLRARGIIATLTIAGAALFGEDEYADELASLVADEEGATLVGHVDDVKTLLDSHDVLVHCSIAPEPFGQVLVQGLGAGLPTVATSVGGPVEILRGAPVELTYTPGDAHALADALLRVSRANARVSEWAIKRAHDFTDENLSTLTDALLRDFDGGKVARRKSQPS